jgi:hypothetical protein
MNAKAGTQIAQISWIEEQKSVKTLNICVPFSSSSRRRRQW